MAAGQTATSPETSAGAWRGLFAEISERADVLALCGDLTNLGAPLVPRRGAR